MTSIVSPFLLAVCSRVTVRDRPGKIPEGKSGVTVGVVGTKRRRVVGPTPPWPGGVAVSEADTYPGRDPPGMARTALAFALVGMVAWGFWAVFAKFASRILAPEVAMVVSYVAAVGLAVAYVLARGIPLELTTAGAAYAVAGGLFSGVGAISYYAALRHGSAAVATTVTALYFVVAAVVGVVALGETVTVRDAAGIALAVGAVVLLST